MWWPPRRSRQRWPRNFFFLALVRGLGVRLCHHHVGQPKAVDHCQHDDRDGERQTKEKEGSRIIFSLIVCKRLQKEKICRCVRKCLSRLSPYWFLWWKESLCSITSAFSFIIQRNPGCNDRHFSSRHHQISLLSFVHSSFSLHEWTFERKRENCVDDREESQPIN